MPIVQPKLVFRVRTRPRNVTLQTGHGGGGCGLHSLRPRFLYDMSLKAGLFAAGSTRIGKALKNVLPTDLNKVRNSTDAAGVGNTCTNGEWECAACTMANSPTAPSCGTCATPRSGSLQEQVDTAMPPPPSTPGEWKCAACTMANAPTVACCGTCATFEVIVPALAAGTTLQAASPDGQLISFQVPAAATTGGIINVAYTPMHTVVSIANISPTGRSNSMNFGETKQYEAAEHPPAGSEVRTLQRELVDLVDMVEVSVRREGMRCTVLVHTLCLHYVTLTVVL